MSQQTSKTIIFPMLFEFKNEDGFVVTVSYADVKQACFNPACTTSTFVSIQLDLSPLDKDLHKGNKFYPICGKCLYKNITILAKYC